MSEEQAKQQQQKMLARMEAQVRARRFAEAVGKSRSLSAQRMQDQLEALDGLKEARETGPIKEVECVVHEDESESYD